MRLVAKGKEGLHRFAVARMLRISEASADGLYSEIQEDTRFLGHIREMEASAGRPLGGFPRPQDLYVICRAVKPDVFVETGVASGLSSAFILKALEQNARGGLHSIDLPDADTEELLGEVLTRLPRGKTSGWAVPGWLRDRWDLRIGKSADLLQGMLASVGKVDIFLHDSEHSYANMMFEFEAVWPAIAAGGLLLSDDVNLPSTKGAFFDFAERVGRKPERLFSGYGAIRK